MKLKLKYPVVSSKSLPELHLLANLIGSFIEYWGFKSVQGRLWCYLYFSKRPLTSLELEQLLEVSPALVTQSVKILLKYKVILPAERGPNGMLRYQANANVAMAIWSVLKSREAVMLGQILEHLKKFEKSKGKTHNQKPMTKSHEEIYELDRKKVTLVLAWTELASLILGCGLKILEQKNNPFSQPNFYRKVIERLFRKFSE